MTKIIRFDLETEDTQVHNIMHHDPYTDTVVTNWNENYYSKVSLDGDSNMIYEWSYGQNKGRISIPSGGCFDIADALEILQACKGDLRGKRTYFKEVEE